LQLLQRFFFGKNDPQVAIFQGKKKGLNSPYLYYRF
jgi:hypothetical protein